MKRSSLALLSSILIATIAVSAFVVFQLRNSNATPPSPSPSPTFEYTAKWICNARLVQSAVVDTASALRIGLVPGEYQTDINVHNPSRSVNLTIVKTFSVSGNESAPILMRASARASLFEGSAFMIDCRDILQAYQNAGLLLCTPFMNVTCAVKGFVTLDLQTSTGVTGFSSPNSLDVVGEYSTESFAPTATFAAGDNFCIFSEFPIVAAPCASSGSSLEVTQISASPVVP